MFTRATLKPLTLLSGLAAVLTLIAGSAGLFSPGIYEPFMPTTALLVGGYAQDLVSLVVAGLLLAATTLTWRGSVRAVLVWAGCLGYLIYAYLLWSFDAVYTVLFPAYIAILSLSLFSLVALLGQIDAGSFRRYVSADMPVRSTAIVLALPALMAPAWLSFLMQGVAIGAPASINSVLVIDLSFIIPASIAIAILVWRRRTWGFILGGIMLVKMVMMSTTLTVSSLWVYTVGSVIDPVWPLYLAMALLGSVTLVRYFQHVGRADMAVTTMDIVLAD